MVRYFTCLTLYLNFSLSFLNIKLNSALLHPPPLRVIDCKRGYKIFSSLINTDVLTLIIQKYKRFNII